MRPGQIQVEQHEVEIRLRLNQVECTAAVARLQHGEAAVELTEYAPQGGPDQCVIVYD
jgi:hypothetical protein